MVAVISILYLATSPDNRFEADDAYSFAAAVEHGDFGSVVNPYHLGYVPLLKAIHAPVKAVAPGLDALPFMAAVGAVAGAITVVIFYLLLIDWLQATKAQAIFGAAALGVSYGFWRYTAEAEVYALAALAAVLLLLVAVRMRPGWLAVVVIAALACFAVLAHALNLALIVALPVLLIQRGWQWHRVIVSAAVFGTAMVAITLGAYSLARANGIDAALDTSYIGFYVGGESGNRLALGDIAPTIGIIGSTVIAANSVFVFEEVRDFLTTAYPANAIADEVTMGATAPEWLRYLAPVLWLGSLIALAVLLWRLRSARFASWKDGYTLYIWLGAYLAIVLIGRGIIQPEVWLLALVPFWAIVVGAMQRVDMRGKLPWVVVAFLAANSVVNGFMPIYLGENRLEEFARWPISNVSQGDLILTADSSSTARFLAYQSPAHTAQIGVGPPEMALENIELLGEMIERELTTAQILKELDARGLIEGFKQISEQAGTLYITRDLFDPPSWLEAARPESADALRALEEQIGHLFFAVDDSDLYLVRATDD
jgi:hypothetical protein